MSTIQAHTAEADAAETGASPHRIVDPPDGTGRMTVETPDGEERTVVDCLDGCVAGRLADRAPGATVRLELSPTADGEGYVATRVLPGALPAL